MQTCGKALITVIALGGSNLAVAADAQQILRAENIESNAAPTQNFTGRVRLEMLWAATEGLSTSGAMVTFEPGARSNWHTHPAGQRLVVTSGVGYTQELGKPRQVIRPGDVVWCPPGVKHWHGAAARTAMTHLAVSPQRAGQNVTWMEPVTDDQYSAK